MKIRNGFVSNSSSSSFVLVGWYLEEDGYKKLVKALYKKEHDDEEDDDEKYEITDSLAKTISKMFDTEKNKDLNFSVNVMDFIDNCGFALVGIESCVFTMDQLTKVYEALKEIKEQIGFDEDPKIHGVGTDIGGYPVYEG